MLEMTPSVILSRPSPCNVPPSDGAVLAAWGWRVEKEYASVAGLPAALPGCLLSILPGSQLLVADVSASEVACQNGFPVAC